MAMETDQLATGVVLQAKEWLYRRLYINHTTSIYKHRSNFKWNDNNGAETGRILRNTLSTHAGDNGTW